VEPGYTVLAGVGGAGVTAVVSYLIARRGKSGTVNTSEAETLWTQAKEMRDELRAEVVACRADVTKMRGELESVQAENTTLKSSLADAKSQIADQKMEISELKMHLADATRELRRVVTEAVTSADKATGDVAVMKREFQVLQGQGG